MAATNFQFIFAYSTMDECDKFLKFAYGMIDLLKATEVSKEREKQRAIAINEWCKLRDKAEKWWLDHGGQEILDELDNE